MKVNNKKILVSGSIAYDYIMNFHGKFQDHILPEKTHELNVSFSINRLKESFGGTAGNITYSLSLLKEKPMLLGVVGFDFLKYKKWLLKNNIDYSLVKEFKNDHSSSAYIITDKKDNQITGFYPGPLSIDYCNIIKKIKNISLAIISPDHKPRMIKYGQLYRKLNIPYIFDPGQQVISFSEKELKILIKGSILTIGNDYEAEIMRKTLKTTKGVLISLSQSFIITKGSRGSILYNQGKVIKQSAVLVKNAIDPTGAGDAYRAGIIKGLVSNWKWPKTLKIASLISSYAVESYGTQKHSFSNKDFRTKYKKEFKEIL